MVDQLIVIFYAPLYYYGVAARITPSLIHWGWLEHDRTQPFFRQALHGLWLMTVTPVKIMPYWRIWTRIF
jgi:hypothetical protein